MRCCMKLGYETTECRAGEDIFVAVPRLREIGCEAIELTISRGWPTAPDQLDAGACERLVNLS